VPAETPRLAGNEVHVWRVELDQPTSYVQELMGSLPADERSRAKRFCFQKDRQHFVVARGILRALLGRYLSLEPGELRFCYGKYGKPALLEESGRDTISFNVSHSHGLALFAIARGRKLGVDLERIRSGLVDDKVAEHFFSAREVRVLRSLPSHLREEAFLNCWTRKEAYIKATGEGLSMSLDLFDVSLVPGEPPAILTTLRDLEEASRWSLSELFPGPAFVAAVAAEGSGWQLECYQWSE